MSVDRPGGHHLGRLVPERRPVTIERDNLLASSPDEPPTVTQILQGYVYGNRCPGLIKAELASITQRHYEATHDPQTGGFIRNPAAWHTYLREAVQALVPGLTPEEADVLAGEDDTGDDEGATSLLRYLGFWKPRGEGDPEATAPSITEPTGQATSDASSPISAAPTAEPSPASGSESPSA